MCIISPLLGVCCFLVLLNRSSCFLGSTHVLCALAIDGHLVFFLFFSFPRGDTWDDRYKFSYRNAVSFFCFNIYVSLLVLFFSRSIAFSLSLSVSWGDATERKGNYRVSFIFLFFRIKYNLLSHLPHPLCRATERNPYITKISLMITRERRAVVTLNETLLGDSLGIFSLSRYHC